MNLNLNDRHFLITGASSGFGAAIARTLLDEGAACTVVARREAELKNIFSDAAERVDFIAGDLTEQEFLQSLISHIQNSSFTGAVLNAGGPPTGTPLETDIAQWDDAYRLVMRWKIELALALAPKLVDNGYGRILFVESKSVKQPLPALVLSNSFRAGVVGFAKSLALEVARNGVTVNVIAPGAHQTPAIERVIQKKSETAGISYDEARKLTEKAVPVGRMGQAEELASLAAWLLSEESGYVTGQTISHDGGAISGLFG